MCSKKGQRKAAQGAHPMDAQTKGLWEENVSTELQEWLLPEERRKSSAEGGLRPLTHLVQGKIAASQS